MGADSGVRAFGNDGWVVEHGRRTRLSGPLVTFDGDLFDPDVPNGDPGATIAQGYQRRGVAVLATLKGRFAVIIRDVERNRLIAASDRMGARPLYWAETADGIAVAPSAAALRTHPGVPDVLDRVVLGELLAQKFVDGSESCLRSIRKLLPGQCLIVEGSGAPRIHTYWEPGRPLQSPPMTPVEIEGRVGNLLEQAVERAMGGKRAGLMLSGGLDSVSVASAAANVCERTKIPHPLALSFGVPDEACAEERRIQQAIAERLRMQQLQFSTDEPDFNLMSEALDLSASCAMPLLNFWFPLHLRMLRAAAAQDCRRVLTGIGGDEWLVPGYRVAADWLRSGNLRALSTMIRAYSAYLGVGRRRTARLLLWQFGARELVKELVARQLGAIPPLARKVALSGRRNWIPDWLLDKTVREAITMRMAGNWVRRTPPPFFRDDRDANIARPLWLVMRQERLAISAMAGVTLIDPFWDSDLVEFLLQVPPESLLAGGRIKSLIRDPLARRFPDLGLERHGKFDYEDYVYRLMHTQLRGIWLRHGRELALADIGLVDGAKVRLWIDGQLAGPPTRGIHQVWFFLSVERWLCACRSPA